MVYGRIFQIPAGACLEIQGILSLSQCKKMGSWLRVDEKPFIGSTIDIEASYQSLDMNIFESFLISVNPRYSLPNAQLSVRCHPLVVFVLSAMLLSFVVWLIGMCVFSLQSVTAMERR